MEGVGDFSTRLWFALIGGVDYMTTPFCRLTAGMDGNKIPKHWAPEFLEPRLRGRFSYHLGPQVMAQDPDLVSRVGRTLLEHADFVELNCGCPSPRPVGHGAGSALLRDPDVFLGFVRKVIDGLGSDRLSVKMRLGFDERGEFPVLLEKIADLPLKRLVIHGRSKSDGYKGLASWEEMALACSRVNYPVIGSGDISDAATLAERLATAPDVAGVIIGRGALRNPWVFKELTVGPVDSVAVTALAKMLECFALLHGVAKQKPQKLYDLVTEGVFAKAYTEEEQWLALRDKLRLIETELDITSLGRLKMLWCYMRFGLPVEYQEPKFLRAKSVQELVDLVLSVGITPVISG